MQNGQQKEEGLKGFIKRRSLAVIIGGMVVGLVLGLLMPTGCGKPDPNEMAREYIEGSIDKLGEDVAGFVVGDNWLLKELGGEYIEDRVNDAIHWSYSPARLVSSGEYQATATASVVFNVDYDILDRTFFVEASLPFDLTIRPESDTVTARPDYAGGRVEHDIPVAPQLPSGAEALEKIDETKDKATDLIKGLGE